MLIRLLCAIFPYRDIVVDGQLYLRRFFITPRSWPVRVFLHRIYLSDAGLLLHCHPWSWLGFIITGGYIEHLPRSGHVLGELLGTIRRRIRPGSVVFRRAEHVHRVELVDGRPAWTCLFVGRTRRVWGFYHDDGTWVDWRTHLGLPKDTADSPEDVVRAVQ